MTYFIILQMSTQRDYGKHLVMVVIEYFRLINSKFLMSYYLEFDAILHLTNLTTTLFH